MLIATRTFRVVISSTFEDLREERHALQRDVFPKLRTLCEEHGARLLGHRSALGRARRGGAGPEDRWKSVCARSGAVSVPVSGPTSSCCSATGMAGSRSEGRTRAAANEAGFDKGVTSKGFTAI
jgi:hypothetical protein